MTDSTQLNWIANFIWGIADDVLRDVYVRGKYRDVILPMVVIRRLDAVLEPTKQAVLSMKAQLDKAGIANQEAALRKAAGQAFYNASPFTLRDLKNRGKAAQLKVDFEAYLDGFSENVKEILGKFKFHNQIPTLHEHDLIGALIEKFLDRSINLSPQPVLNEDRSVKVPALDNHGMGTVFEELIRRFNEENNEEAGEHFTPRDVVALMADLIFLPIAADIKDATYTVYDGACGTGGMLTVAEQRLRALAREHEKEVEIHLFGQEVNGETYAITKADLLLKGEGQEADNFRHGSTLSNDGFPGMEFNFMLSNPPYGKSWKTDLEKMGGKDGIKDPRFIINHAGDPEYSLLTRSSDGQLLFLVNKLVKMKADFDKYPFGSRIAHQHIKDRRARKGVKVAARGTLADYVPFYFAPRSPMLCAIWKNRVAGYAEGQEQVVHLVFGEFRVGCRNSVATGGFKAPRWRSSPFAPPQMPGAEPGNRRGRSGRLLRAKHDSEAIESWKKKERDGWACHLKLTA